MNPDRPDWNLDPKALMAAAKAQEKANIELQAAFQAALANPLEIWTFNQCALGLADQPDGTKILMIGLLNGRQLRVNLHARTIAEFHKATAPKPDVDANGARS